ncbi:MAG TPA: inositol monophosphatase family protein, partial [Nitrosospira sp.]
AQSSWKCFAGMDTGQALAFAHYLADQARPIALRYFRAPLDIMRKTDESLVTVADYEIECALRQVIQERYPHHGIIGEEYGSTPGKISWVLDPIDGTANFIAGNPLFGTLIGLLSANEPFIGLIDIPAMGERWAGDGKRTLFYTGNGRCTAAVSACESLDRARLYIALPDSLHAGAQDTIDALNERVAVSRPSCDCYAYGLLASGHCDLVLEDDLEPHDYLPIVPVVTGAGGWMTDWRGNPLGLHSSGRVIAAATRPLLDAAIDALKNC